MIVELNKQCRLALNKHKQHIPTGKPSYSANPAPDTLPLCDAGGINTLVLQVKTLEPDSEFRKAISQDGKEKDSGGGSSRPGLGNPGRWLPTFFPHPLGLHLCTLCTMGLPLQDAGKT